MHTAVFAEMTAHFPGHGRTTWNGLVHRACAEAHGNRIIRDAPDHDVLPEDRVVCIHCSQLLNPKDN